MVPRLVFEAAAKQVGLLGPLGSPGGAHTLALLFYLFILSYIIFYFKFSTVACQNVLGFLDGVLCYALHDGEGTLTRATEYLTEIHTPCRGKCSVLDATVKYCTFAVVDEASICVST